MLLLKIENISVVCLEDEKDDSFDWGSYLLEGDYTAHRGTITNTLVCHMLMSGLSVKDRTCPGQNSQIPPPIIPFPLMCALTVQHLSIIRFLCSFPRHNQHRFLDRGSFWCINGHLATTLCHWVLCLMLFRHIFLEFLVFSFLLLHLATTHYRCCSVQKIFLYHNSFLFLKYSNVHFLLTYPPLHIVVCRLGS